MTAQLALDWSRTMARSHDADSPSVAALRTCDGPRNAPLKGKRAPTTYGGDWSERDDPLPDPSVLFRTGSPRCWCRNGCGHVYGSESAYERHLEMLPNGDARYRTAAELRAFPKRPMFRDAAGVWHSGETVKGGES